MPSQRPSYDVVIIGAGFSGIYLLHNLRKLGYTVRVYETGSDLGGVWHWNKGLGDVVVLTEKYPSADELRGYFAHLERVLGVKKDIEFGRTVTGAWFDKAAEGKRKWTVETDDGRVTQCQLLLSCVGLMTERYVPDIPGLETFQGRICHSASWPKGAVDVAGKKAAVMEQAHQANREVYDFWVKKTRARINDARLQKILAPDEPPHPINTKRSSMENDYFEQFNKPNVHLVNLREPGCVIAAIKPDGLVLQNGTFYPLDVIALATGFNSYTGSLTQIPRLRNTSGITLAEEWAQDGASSYLGLARRGYPNMFLCYALHGPSALSSGPVSIELQARWIIEAIRKIDEPGLTYIEPTEEAEKTWKATINQITEMTLFP
ncbi:flavin-containing monooxygenase [Aspergillus foveolatus]|uniref:flavin-containing monooxygenase n=1 Tax=Aspergillus foveolatus TaxID=210207 RepID=UPI003CCD9B25